jgi:hypothetical protein
MTAVAPAALAELQKCLTECAYQLIALELPHDRTPDPAVAALFRPELAVADLGDAVGLSAKVLGEVAVIEPYGQGALGQLLVDCPFGCTKVVYARGNFDLTPWRNSLSLMIGSSGLLIGGYRDVTITTAECEGVIRIVETVPGRHVTSYTFVPVG